MLLEYAENLQIILLTTMASKASFKSVQMQSRVLHGIVGSIGMLNMQAEMHMS